MDNAKDIIDRLGEVFWRGLTIGGILGLIINVLFLPASIMMNANIHHHPLIRFFVGILTFIPPLWLVILAYGLFSMQKRQYFGMLPLMSSFGSKMDPPAHWYDWPWYLFKNVENFGAIIIEPFFFINPEGFTQHLQILYNTSGPKVNEGLYEAARDAATLDKKEEWAFEMERLALLVANNTPVPSKSDRPKVAS